MAQREILFMAWDNTEKRMCNVLAINWDEKLLFWERNVGMENYDSDWWPIDGFTLLQYTGLKDKNGKEIYEGSIIKFNKDEDTYVGVIGDMDYRGCVVKYKDRIFNNEIIPIKLAHGFYHNFVQLNSLWHKDIEIIGNVYSNPELISPPQNQ